MTVNGRILSDFILLSNNSRLDFFLVKMWGSKDFSFKIYLSF